MFKKLVSHTAIYGLAPHIPRIASVFTLPIITQYLTDLDYGVYGTITSYQGLISVLSTIGLRVVLVNSFYKSPSQFKWLWRQVYGFLIQWSILFSALSALLLYLIIPSEASNNRLLIILLSIGPVILFGPTNLIGANYYQLKQRPLPIAIRTVASGLLTVMLNLYLIAELKMGYMGWIWTSFITSILVNISYFVPVYFSLKLAPILNYKRRTLIKALKVSVPLVPHYYSSYLLNSSDKVVMDNMGVSTESIGKYNVSYTVAKIVGSLGNAVGMSTGPILSQFYKNEDFVKARDLVLVTQFGFLMLCGLLGVWMKEIFGFLIQNEELASVYYLGVILVMAYAYRPMYLGAGTLIMYSEKTTWVPKLTFTSGLLNVVLNIILIPVLGFEVAVFSTWLGYMLLGYGFYFSKHVRAMLKVNYYPLPMFILSLMVTILVYLARDISLVSKLTISLVSGTAVLFILLKSRAIRNG